MAIDYFISYSMKEKLDLLRGLTESLMTGQVVRVKTSAAVETQFNPNVDNSLIYQRLCWSIANDDNHRHPDRHHRESLLLDYLHRGR